MCQEQWRADAATVAADGNEEQPTWVRVAAFGDLARRCVEELQKGSRCLVEGALRQSSWTDKKTGETCFGLEVAAWRCEPLGLIGERRPKKPKDGHGDSARRLAGTSNDPSDAPTENAGPRPSQAANAGCAGNDV